LLDKYAEASLDPTDTKKLLNIFDISLLSVISQFWYERSFGPVVVFLPLPRSYFGF